MKHNTMKAITLSLLVSIVGTNSYAILDDNLGLTDKGQKQKFSLQSTLEKLNPFKKSASLKSIRSNNKKKMIAEKAKNKKPVVASIGSVKIKPTQKSLGSVPTHIQENWDSLTKDQKDIIYSYHNENPYAKIGQDHFANMDKSNKEIYEHDTAYGFDSNKQASLDDLRRDINNSERDDISEEAQLVIDTLAALEE
jgi:hypothetical protein